MSRPAPPTVSSPFEWQTGPVGLVLTASALLPFGRHLFSTRERDFRQPADFDALAEALGMPAGSVVRVRQVHGRGVLVVRPGEQAPADAAADAVVSLDPSRVASVRVADCVPILLADRRRRGVAAVHAGWRGACAGVAGAAIDALAAAGIPPTDLVAAIGPSVGPCCYQVDDRVRNSFLAITPDAVAWFEPDGPGHWRLDLRAAVAEQLQWAGVPAGAVFQSAVCTADAVDHCSSYRREGESAGRMVAAIRMG